MKKFSIAFLNLSILTSFITQTFGNSGLLTRITFADLLGTISFIVYIGVNNFFTTTGYKAAFFILFTFSFGLFQTEDLGQTLTELLVLLFLVNSSITIYSVYRSQEGFITLINLIVYTSILTCLFGFYGLLAMITGLPNIFPGRASGEILSGFRNAGQAGAFVLMMLTILFPVKFSSVYQLFNKRQKFLLNISLYFLVIFLFLTGKIAAYIGFAFCIVFSILQKRNYGYVFLVLFMAGLISVVWSNLENLAPDVYNRINQKFETRVTNNLNDENDIEDGFIAKNILLAFSVFDKHPITGSGIGGFAGIYSSHEVHSTYFKIVGETGVLGIISYSIFLIVLLSFFSGTNKARKTNHYADFLWNLRPFLFGSMISWFYTYHLRKREFWIFFAVISIANYLYRNTNFELVSSKANIYENNN